MHFGLGLGRLETSVAMTAWNPWRFVERYARRSDCQEERQRDVTGRRIATERRREDVSANQRDSPYARSGSLEAGPEGQPHQFIDGSRCSKKSSFTNARRLRTPTFSKTLERWR